MPGDLAHGCSRSGLRLPRPGPDTLTDTELVVIDMLLVEHVRWARRAIRDGHGSDAIERTCRDAENAQRKIARVIG